eukprot:9656648-Ditylum_brightwellii.AAC.1
MSATLPHVAIPLGDELDKDLNPVLEGGVDTMCGANVGNINYHQSIKEKHLHLIAQFTKLSDATEQWPFGIGGIGDRGEKGNGGGGIWITHVISYRTPFVVNGQQVFIMLGLGEVVMNTLFSFPFMNALKATIMLESCTMVSSLLGQAFKLKLRPPRLAASAHLASPGVPVVLMTRAPNTVRVIQECLDRVGDGNGGPGNGDGGRQHGRRRGGQPMTGGWGTGAGRERAGADWLPSGKRREGDSWGNKTKY